jgi:transposase
VARGYRPVERDQQLLVPPDLREWLPAGHPVWLLIEACGAGHDRVSRPLSGWWAGWAGYDPHMMLALLFYAYARGIRSSRSVERLCWEDVGFRVICAQDVPDHTTIWRFADASAELAQELFTEVLVLCAKAGMGRLETITLDGMKIGVNASAKAKQHRGADPGGAGPGGPGCGGRAPRHRRGGNALFDPARGMSCPRSWPTRGRASLSQLIRTLTRSGQSVPAT